MSSGKFGLSVLLAIIYAIGLAYCISDIKDTKEKLQGTFGERVRTVISIIRFCCDVFIDDSRSYSMRIRK